MVLNKLCSVPLSIGFSLGVTFGDRFCPVTSNDVGNWVHYYVSGLMLGLSSQLSIDLTSSTWSLQISFSILSAVIFCIDWGYKSCRCAMRLRT